MIYYPSEQAGWTKSALITTHITPLDCGSAIIHLHRAYYWTETKTGVLLSENFLQELTPQEAANYKDIGNDHPLPEGRGYLSIEFVPGKDIARCNFDSVPPELRIDKKSGKFYCVCPSSFIFKTESEEIGECDVLSDADAWQKRLRDTIPEAVEVWNSDQYNEALIPELIQIYKTNASYTHFVETVRTKYFSDLKYCDITDGRAARISKILGIMGIDWNFYESKNYREPYNWNRFIRGGALEKETQDMFQQLENQIYMHLFRWIETLATKG